jgi:hypothetical protein
MTAHKLIAIGKMWYQLKINNYFVPVSLIQLAGCKDVVLYM